MLTRYFHIDVSNNKIALETFYDKLSFDGFALPI